jgi:hypothetical protein
MKPRRVRFNLSSMTRRSALAGQLSAAVVVPALHWARLELEKGARKKKTPAPREEIPSSGGG